jgi:hypothetical protein
MRRITIGAAALLATTTLGAGTATALTPGTMVQGVSPYAADCHGAPQGGTLFKNSEVEPWLASNENPDATADPDALLGAWQQDRFSSGGSSGLLVAYSHDGGGTWTVPPLANQPKISNCNDPDGDAGTSSDWERATDPWTAISPNGFMWFMSLSFNDTRNLDNAMLASRSTDGGVTWSDPTTLIVDRDRNVFNDKNTMTADPNTSDNVYAVWDRLVFPNEQSQGQHSELAAAFKGPTYFSKTENGTAANPTWTTTKILDFGRNDQTIANQIGVLPREPGDTESTLINVFNWIHNDNQGGRKGQKIAAMTSTNSGDTWSEPVVIDRLAGASLSDTDPDGAPCPVKVTPTSSYRCPLRTGDLVPDISVDLNTGTAYVVWQNGGSNGNVQIFLSKSTDGGATWTAPERVNANIATDAHTPSVDVDDAGNVAVSYYDFRNNVTGDGILRTSHWIHRSTNGGASFGAEEQLGADFDTRKAPFAVGYFLGDYDGLASVGTVFKPFWTSTEGSTAGKPVLSGGVDPANRTNVFAASLTPP